MRFFVSHFFYNHSLNTQSHMKKSYSLGLCSMVCFSLLAQGSFTKITDTANPITQLTSNARYRGAAWVDVNNDGKVDLFAAPNALFLNKGNGQFEAKNPNIAIPTLSVAGVSFADYNNDGNLDMLACNPRNNLYLGNGDGTFRSISVQIPNNINQFGWACAFGDINNDAKMDFIFAHPAGFLVRPSQTNKLYKQTETGIQQIISNYAVTNDTFPYTVPYWSDYDMDGDVDLFVASGPGGTPGLDFCYKNLFKELGKDSFSRLTQPLFAAQTQDGQTYNFVDVDNDGDLDLCLTNYNGAPTRFYRRQADGSFVSETTPFTTVGTRLDNAWGDFDNDGDLDVIMTSDNGVNAEYYQNNGAGVFTANTTTDITTAARCSGATIGDYDNDGDLDVFIHGIVRAGNEKTFGLYRSSYSTNGNKWVNFQLTGVQSNKAAIGTKVRIKATIDGRAVWQMREVSAQNTFQGQNDLRVHFGLKNATRIDSIELIWLSGRKDVFANIALNNFYKITEGGAISLIVGLEDSPNLDNLVKIYPNPVQNELKIETDPSLILKSDVEIFDVSGRIVARMPFRNSLSVADLTNGIFYLRLYAEKGVIMKKFIKP
jgi:enediyne biosynthesis protein E4